MTHSEYQRVLPWLLLIVALIDPDVATANWGGGSVSGNAEVGDFTAIGVEQVEMQEESLRILLMMEHAEVHVDYVLHNTGEDIVVRAGFPGERLYFVERAVEEDKVTEVYYSEHDNDIFDYRIIADGEILPWQIQKRGADRLTDTGYSAIAPYWFVSELSFAAGQTRKVSISYLAKYGEVGGSISDDWEYEKAQFVYRLSTGAVWKGPIEKGKVTIETKGLDLSHWKADKRFVRQGKAWVWQFEKLEPTVKSDIIIPVKDKYSQIAKYEDYGKPCRFNSFYEQRGNKWSRIISQFDVSATSVLNQLKDTFNVVCDEYRSAWCEGVEGPGLGERLTITLKKATRVDTINIRPGFTKRYAPENHELFQAYNRIARLKVRVDNGAPFEVSFHDEFLKNSEFRIPSRTKKPVRKIEFEILDVYKGTKYDDTCISEISVQHPLPGKPKLPSLCEESGCW